MRAERVWSWLVLAILCAAALRVGIHTTGDLTWPPGPDFSRDIASAQTIADGHPLADPFYPHETIWYNPLVPGLVALVNVATGAPIPLLYARLGAYLNLIAPLGLFLLVAATRGRGAALLAVCAFVFLVPGREPAWLCATYSPWLLPLHFVQGVFYLALFAYGRARAAAGMRWHVVAGILAGLTFLGHSAPALMLAGVVAADLAWQAARPADKSGPIGVRHVIVFATCALVVVLPLVASVLGRYHATILNPRPGAWIAPGLRLDEAPAVITGILRGQPWLLVLALIGLVRLIAARADRRVRILLLWGLSAALLLASAYFSQWMARLGRSWPQPVPGFHFLFSLRAFEAVLVGVGLWTVSEGLGGWTFSRLRVQSPAAGRIVRSAARAVVAAAVAAAVVLRLPAYARRPDFVMERQLALAMFQDPNLQAMYQWLRDETAPRDVFLAPSNLSLSVIGPAGRKVVEVDALFSSPFVNWDAREDAARAMREAIDRDDQQQFLVQSSRYEVDYVVLLGRGPGRSLSQIMTAEWHGGPWTIYRLRKSR